MEPENRGSSPRVRVCPWCPDRYRGPSVDRTCRWIWTRRSGERVTDIGTGGRRYFGNMNFYFTLS